MDPIRWTTPEHATRDRGRDWYWALGIIAAAGAAVAFVLGNILFSVVIVLGAVSIALSSRKRGEEFTFEVNDTGVVIGSRLYPYRTLESFWIPDEGAPRIILHSNKVLMPQIVIPLGETVPVDDVHELLAEHLDEEEHTEPLLERLGEWFGL